MPSFHWRRLMPGAPCIAVAALSVGCASFSPDGGFAPIENTAQTRLGKELRWARADADQSAHPPGSVAHERTRALPDPARDSQRGAGSGLPNAQPAQPTEVTVRKPASGHAGHRTKETA